jgi:hypothetical protein
MSERVSSMSGGAGCGMPQGLRLRGGCGGGRDRGRATQKTVVDSKDFEKIQ